MKEIYHIGKMSAKRTADAAMTVAEDALRRIRRIESGESPLLITITVVLSLAYLYFIRNMIKDNNATQAMKTLNVYDNPLITLVAVTIVIVGLSGVFGKSIQLSVGIAGFAFVIGHLFLLQAALAPVFAGTSAQMAAMKKENFAAMGYPINVPRPRCGPCANGKGSYNPEPYRPDTAILGIGDPDPLPPSGVDFLSDPPGVYTTSGIAYDMGLA